MADQPTLQEFLRKNPGKGLNDYFEAYGKPPPATHEAGKPHSYITPKPKERITINALALLASLLVLAAFFLPWVDVAGFQTAGEWTTAPGRQLPALMRELLPDRFSPPSFLTVYLIPIGASLALAGELSRSWAVRLIGQILALSFVFYWTRRLCILFEASGLKPEAAEIGTFLQYGFHMTAVGAALYLLDVIRAALGRR